MEALDDTNLQNDLEKQAKIQDQDLGLDILMDPDFLKNPAYHSRNANDFVPSFSHKFWWDRYNQFGPVFEACGMVCVTDPEIVHKNVAGPQKRPYRLGQVDLDNIGLCEGPNHKGETAFVLTLENNGQGQHKKVRDAMAKYIFTPEAYKRASVSSSARALKLTTNAVNQFQEHGPKAFCERTKMANGMLREWTSAVLFHALTGLDSDMDPAFSKVALYRGLPSAWMLFPSPAKDPEGFKTDFEAAAKFFHDCPALANYDEAAVGLSKMDFARHLTTILVLKGNGLGFDLVFQQMVTEGKTLPPDFTRSTVVPVETWLEAGTDREKIRLIILESLRLNPSAPGLVTEAKEPFTLTVRGKERTFPVGTRVFNMILMDQLDEKTHGEKPETMCPFKRGKSLWGECSKLMAFSSVGDNTPKDDPRMCPGRDISLEILTDFFVELAERGHWGYFLVVADGKVVKKFANVGDAKKYLADNYSPGSYTPQRMCVEVQNGVVSPDPHTCGGENQGGGLNAGWNKFWWDWNAINAMNDVATKWIEAQKSKGSTYYLVVANGTVVNKFDDIEDAKSCLMNSYTAGSSYPERMCVEVSKGIVSPDPHTCGGQNQGGGLNAGWNKFWWNWDSINAMNAVATAWVQANS